MSNRICRLIGIIIALLSLTEAAAFAGWKGAVIGQDMNGTVTVDTAGTSHIVALTAYKGFDLVYTTYNRSGVRGSDTQEQRRHDNAAGDGDCDRFKKPSVRRNCQCR